MIVIEVKKGESIDKALKRYKFKVIKTKQMEKLRDGQEFTKKSVEKRIPSDIIYKTPSLFLDGIFLKTPPIHISNINIISYLWF